MQTKPNFIFRTVTQGVDSLWSTNLPGNRGGEALFHIARFEGASDVEEEIASHERSIKKIGYSMSKWCLRQTLMV